MWLNALSPQDLVAMFGVSVAALVLSWLTMLRFAQRGTIIAQPEPALPDAAAFLFRDGQMVDGTDGAHLLLEVSEPRGSDLARVLRVLAPQYPTLFETVAELTEGAEATIIAQDRAGRVRLSLRSGALRLRVEDHGAPSKCDPATRHVIDSLHNAVRQNRGLTDCIGFPVWRQSADGQVIWANGPYRALEEAMTQKAAEGDRPPPPAPEGLDSGAAPGAAALFDGVFDPCGSANRLQRGKLEMPGGGEPRWFEFQMRPLDEDLLITAVPIDRVILAERSLSGFVQTLTQTFAHLHVGLAIFNRARELAIFNPALTELLDLSPEFLAMQPSLTQVFDRMREQRVVPEQKNYKAWRGKIEALAAAASQEVFSETWSLADGRTFRVTGRPHPDGAVAFLFEDISGEITLERGFRTELQMGHAVIDGLQEAIAVFSSAGEMTLCNRAYHKLWHCSEEVGGAPQHCLTEASGIWQKAARPTPIWGDVRDFAGTMGERSNWTAEVRLKDGRALNCRFEALSGGYTLVGFAEAELRPLGSAEAEPRAIGSAEDRLSA